MPQFRSDRTKRLVHAGTVQEHHHSMRSTAVKQAATPPLASRMRSGFTWITSVEATVPALSRSEAAA